MAAVADRIQTDAQHRIQIRGALAPGYAEILAPGALAFLAELHQRFDATRLALLAARVERERRG